MDWNTIKQEVNFKTSRSSGAGGQHVNKTESRVELIFDVKNSPSLSAQEKRNLKHHLGKRLKSPGYISIVNQSDRSQHTNKRRALDSLETMLHKGIRTIPRKHIGKPFVANKHKRLKRKQRQSEKKADRQKKWL